MSDLVELSVSTLSQAQRRVEIVAENLANATTPAYKRRVAFSTLVNNQSTNATSTPRVAAAIDFRAGKLVQTSNPYDFAVAGPGYFAVRYDNRLAYTRLGQFTRADDGRLVNAQGGVLQLANGSDAVVSSSKFALRSDGTIVEDGILQGRIAVFATAQESGLQVVDGGFSSGAGQLTLSDDAGVHQGAYEASNVSSGDEMVLMMEALRRAEAGQRVMNVYDDLMGRVVTTFGESVR
jgi:flagellar basal-body rod protein FlgF